MAGNSSLHAAGIAKNDEFYTQYSDIQSELNHYEKHFAGKTVLCNCDDPFESNFCKFFLRNFNYLKLKRLICTSYHTSPVAWQQMSLWDEENIPVTAGNGRGYVMDISEVPMANGRGVSDEDIDRLLKSNKYVKKLKGDGDFRSEECIEYLKQADIVVTNPPFSLFRTFLAQLIEYNKKFIIIGNKNAITYKEVFPLIMENRMWTGCRGFSGGMWFYAEYEGKTEKIINGQKLINVPSIWFTNLDHPKRHEEIVLYKRYYGNEADYPKYDNYNAINVDKVSDIPCDYFEDMGVPITYLDKHNPEQFEIVSADDIRANSNVPIKGHGLIKDKEATIQEKFTNKGLTNQQENDTIAASCKLQAASCKLQAASCKLQAASCKLQAASAQPMPDWSSGASCNGVMGVPITFLDKFNPEQFVIVGATESEGKGFSNGLWYAETGIAQPVVDGERRYKRLFVKRRMQRSDGSSDNLS